MDAKPINIAAHYISKHVNYWSKIDAIKAEILGISPAFGSDDEFIDCYGMSHAIMRRIRNKSKILATERNNENKTKQ